MLLSAPPSERTAGTTSSRTQCTMASAKLQRRIAGGVTATCLLSASRTASSLTTSSTTHSPGPASAGSDGATANSAVSRSRQAEGAGASPGVASCVGMTGETSTGRGRGNGTTREAAKPQGAKAQRAARTMSAWRDFTVAISARIATLWRPIGTADPRKQPRHNGSGQGRPRGDLRWPLLRRSKRATTLARVGETDGRPDSMAHFDVVVCGLGAMGSAAVQHLARRGKRVLGLERYAPGHDRGSSHGLTRIIRLGYFEHPSYVPLLRHAYKLWHELEQAIGRRLLHVTGIAELGPPDGALVRGTLACAHLHALRHELLAAPELMRRFPAFKVPPDYVAVVQPDGGVLEVEPAIAAQLALATAAGAEIRTGELARAVEPRADRVRIVTDRGSVEAGAAIVTAGAWVRSLLPDLAAPLRVTREVMGWFESTDAQLFSGGRTPVFIIESRHGMHYGIPPQASVHGGIKVAKHHHRNETVDPDAYDRAVSAADEALIRAAMAEHIPAANGRLIAAKTCLYTMTPDGDFVIDRLPGASNIIVASPCSGHGFKFAPVIGEILGDLATTGATPHDIARFSLGRFG